MPIKDYALLSLVIFIWGVNFLVMKIGLDEVPPMILGLLRFFCVVIPAIVFIKKPKTTYKHLINYGLTISFGQFGFMFLAIYLGFPTGLAALILQIQVFLTVIFAALLFKESIQKHHIFAMLCAALGLFLIGIGQYQGSLPILSMIPVLLSALCWALGNIIVKKIGAVDALGLVVWGNISACIGFFVVSFLFYGIYGIMEHLQNLTYKGIMSVLFMSFVANFIGYTSWGYLLTRHAANKIMPFIMLVPIIALIIGYVFLQERLGIWHWLGIGVVLLGLCIHIFGKIPLKTLHNLKR